MSSSRRDSRFGQDEEPLTDFERDLQRRLFGKSQDFPAEFTSWLRLQVEKDPPRLLPSNVDRVYNVPRARVYNSGTQSVSNNTITTLSFDSESYDPWAMHDTSTNTSRLTVTEPGVYLIGGHLEWASDATNIRGIYIRLNGSTVLGYVIANAVNGFATVLNVVTEYQLTTGDYVELRGYQNSGGMLDAAGGLSGCSMFISFVADYPPS